MNKCSTCNYSIKKVQESKYYYYICQTCGHIKGFNPTKRYFKGGPIHKCHHCLDETDLLEEKWLDWSHANEHFVLGGAL